MELLLGNCLDRLKDLEDNSVDAIVTDPPYGLSFMGKKWDYDVPKMEIWEECLRVLKPGGYLLSFAGTRTQHRMAVNIEDAGFEIRDMIAWIYASGFPKSLNIGKAVDKLQGNEREVTGSYKVPDIRGDAYGTMNDKQGGSYKNIEVSQTKGTSDWEGWGTALKPALEPITVARKPLGEKTVAENCLKWGVGGINIDGCRVGTGEDKIKGGCKESDKGWNKLTNNNKKEATEHIYSTGRFPANLIHDGSDEVVGLFPQTKSGGGNKNSVNNQEDSFLGTGFGGTGTKTDWKIDSGSASRFFYCAKASKRERNIGCEGLEEVVHNDGRDEGLDSGHMPQNRSNTPKQNFHPTVKPLALMEYLVKLVSREGQVILDPFMGSGTTGMACKKLDREFIGIEMMPEYMEIAKCRIEGVKKREQLNMI